MSKDQTTQEVQPDERSLVDILPFCPWLANNHAELEACA